MTKQIRAILEPEKVFERNDNSAVGEDFAAAQPNAETAQAILDAREGRTTLTTIDDILANIDRK